MFYEQLEYNYIFVEQLFKENEISNNDYVIIVYFSKHDQNPYTSSNFFIY